MRKRKLDSVYIHEFANILQSINNGFFSEHRVKNKGRLFKLTKCLSEKDKSAFDGFSNVMFFKGHYCYAPEIKFSAILITDKTVKYLESKGIIKSINAKNINNELEEN